MKRSYELTAGRVHTAVDTPIDIFLKRIRDRLLQRQCTAFIPSRLEFPLS